MGPTGVRPLHDVPLGDEPLPQSLLLPQPQPQPQPLPLPRLPRPSGLQLAVRYLPGEAGLQASGDWYDAVVVDDHRLFFTVGDVSGRGRDAAGTMSSLRSTLRACAAMRYEPERALSDLAALLDIRRDGRFATSLCGSIDTRDGTTTIASAGHPPLLAVAGGRACFLATEAGIPIGLGRARYTPLRLRIAPGTTLLGFTDGLFERRGEPIDIGLARLRSAAEEDLPLEELLDHLIAELVGSGSGDDVALLGMTWQPAGLGAGGQAGALRQRQAPAA
ncbi:MAG TPA: PP2C family protein-serine/threonine phosphatase [Acidimicrobiales bacterium]|nr:PP2C family protein-serine/threonine phosphatase [Acidimicrobiales bacterium]